MESEVNKTTKPYTAKQAIIDLTALYGTRDIEVARGKADDVLCKLLNTLGYQDVVAAYTKVEKWYA